LDLFYSCTRHVTSSNYSATAGLHTLQITTAPAKLFFLPLSSAAVSWQRPLTMEILHLPAFRSYLHRLSFRTACQLFPRLSLPCRAELHSALFFTTELPKSGSQLLHDWRLTANQLVLAWSPLRLTTSNFIFQLNTCCYRPYVTSSLTRGWVCRLQLMLVLASALILEFESRGTRKHILLPPFVASYNLQDYGEGIRPRLHTGYN
jgi:hypothetical protein